MTACKEDGVYMAACEEYGVWMTACGRRADGVHIAEKWCSEADVMPTKKTYRGTVPQCGAVGRIDAMQRRMDAEAM